MRFLNAVVGLGASMIAAGIVAASAAPASAHHSFAMFDDHKIVTLAGTVTEFQWTNPHSWVELLAKDPTTGKDVQWSIECISPNQLARAGWKRTSLKVGDKVSADIHPMKDGSIGGALVSVTVNGLTLSNHGI